MTDIICFYVFFFLFSLCICKWNKVLGYAVFLSGSLLSLIDYFSMQILNTLINLLVLTSVDLTLLKMAPKVVPVYFWGGLLLVVFHIAVPLILYRYWEKRKTESINFSRFPYYIGALVLIVSAGCLYCFPKTVVAYKQMAAHSYNLYKNKNVPTKDLFAQLGSKEQYVTIDQVNAAPGKNLVIIYCESLESNFLDGKRFPVETGRLRDLSRKNMNFYTNYECAFGSGWTIAALYATQTGFPCLFGANQARLGGNSALANIHNVKAVSYAGVLAKAGYKNVFLTNSSLKFAGTGNLMSLFGYECKSWKTFGKNVVKTKWGVHDYDLFEAAKRKFKELNQKKQPFNLTLLTIDTHYPKGVPDARLRNKISKKIPVNSHEYTVASLDYLLDDFLKVIEKNSQNNETVVVILGDHLMHGNSKVTPIVKKLQSKPRKILLMSNKEIHGFGNNDKIAFYDIPQIVLNLAEVKSNAKFLKGQGIKMSSEFIEKNQDIFTILNMRLCQ